MHEPSAANERVVFLTGASSGIGEALARELAHRGLRVALGARRTDRLRALARELGGDGRALALSCDVTHDGSVEEAVRRTIDTFGRLDVCVANAGYAVHGSLSTLTIDDYRRQLETNFFGVLRTLYASLPSLRSSRGQLVFTGSVAGHLAPPLGASAYSASKFALRGLAEGIRAELAHEGIGVTLVSPGFVQTEIGRVDNRGALRDEDRMPAPTWLRMPAAKAARDIADAIERRAPEVVVTLHGKALVALSRLAPGLLRAGSMRVRVPSRKES